MKSNRYLFIKRIYPQYIILLKKDKKYITYGIDKEILNYIKFHKLKRLSKLEINYIVLDNLFISDKECFKDNKYKLYYEKVKLLKIIRYLIFRNKD